MSEDSSGAEMISVHIRNLEIVGANRILKSAVVMGHSTGAGSV